MSWAAFWTDRLLRRTKRQTAAGEERERKHFLCYNFNYMHRLNIYTTFYHANKTALELDSECVSKRKRDPYCIDQCLKHKGWPDWSDLWTIHNTWPRALISLTRSPFAPFTPKTPSHYQTPLNPTPLILLFSA